MKCKHCNKILTTQATYTQHIKTCNSLYNNKDCIINDYLDGKSINNLSSLYLIGRNSIRKFLYENEIKIRTYAESVNTFPDKFKLSHEHKNKIRNSRIKWLKLNPDKHVWKSNKKFISKPCEYLKLQLTNNGIQFVSEYTPFAHLDRYYSVDIAFPDIKYGVEINGNQHYDEHGGLSEYYKNRQLFFESNGWKLLQLHYTDAYKIDPNSILDKSYIQLNLNNNYVRYTKQSKIKSSKRLDNMIELQSTRLIDFNDTYPKKGWCNTLAQKWDMTSQAVGRYCNKYFNVQREIITKESILNYLSKGVSLRKIAKLYNIHPTTVGDYCKKYDITIPTPINKINWNSINLQEKLKYKNPSQIAKELGVTPRSIYNQMKKHT